MTFLYKADPQRGERWAELFSAKAPDIEFQIWPGTAEPKSVRYLAVWEPPARIAETYPNLEILFSIAAGVDKIDFDALADVARADHQLAALRHRLPRWHPPSGPA